MKQNRVKSCSCWFIVLSFTVCYTCCTDDDVSPNAVFNHDHRFFLQQIFDKYGDKGIITFEGFEHLLENLGLGRLSFDKEHNVSMHRINGSFQDVHDALHLHDHRHGAKENVDLYLDGTVSSGEAAHFFEADEVFAKAGDFSADNQSERTTSTVVKRSAIKDNPEKTMVEPADDGLCLSPKALLQTFGLRPNHSVVIKPSRFLHLCPAIVYQLDRKTCSVSAAPVTSSDKSPRAKVSQSEAWLHATLATAAISAVGLLAVAMVKLARRRWFLHFLVSLAVGTLSGDALLHLLPHALLSDDINHETAALRCSATFMAIIFFYGLEAVLLVVKSSRTKKVSTEKIEASIELKPAFSESAKSVRDDGESGSMLAPTGHGHSHGIPAGSGSSLAFLILVGDGLHNLTDGLAIGASFASDPVAGLATAIAVFCHELPHELGDFAVLINAGMSVKRALLYNLLTSVLSFIGAAAGVWLGEFADATYWIYATTAGTFLYIALADLIPEMTTYVKNDFKIQGIFIQLTGITSGGMLMLLIALYEEKLHDFLV